MLGIGLGAVSNDGRANPEAPRSCTNGEAVQVMFFKRTRSNLVHYSLIVQVPEEVWFDVLRVADEYAAQKGRAAGDDMLLLLAQEKSVSQIVSCVEEYSQVTHFREHCELSTLWLCATSGTARGIYDDCIVAQTNARSSALRPPPQSLPETQNSGVATSVDAAVVR